MIFCFSGTGNSLHVAERVAERTNDTIVMMTETELKSMKVYQLTEKENLGFVFPIYWWGIPIQVERFLESMKFMHSSSFYTYAICTYGQVKNNGLDDLQKLLKKRGVLLDASFEVKMVDNYIAGYEIANQEKQRVILQKAETQIEEIISAICAEEKCKTKDYFEFIKPLVHNLYKKTDHKKDFFVTNNCIRCGKCQQECPSEAIQIVDGQPIWTQSCSFCMKCINSCPVQAVQYKKTEGRTRYFYQNTQVDCVK